MTWLGAVLTLLKFVMWAAEFLQRAKVIKAAEVEQTRRLLTAAREESDAIIREMDAAARRADSDGVRDPFERP